MAGRCWKLIHINTDTHKEKEIFCDNTTVFSLSCCNSPHHRSTCHRSLTQAGSEWPQEPSRGRYPPLSYGWYGRGTWTPRSHKSEIQAAREPLWKQQTTNGVQMTSMCCLVVCTSQDLCYKPSTLCLLSLPLRRKQRNQNCDTRHWHATTAHGQAAERKWGDRRGSEEQTVAWLEVSVDDFDWSFCMEVMHSCKVIKH